MNRKALSKMASVFIVFMMVATSFAVVVSYDEDANSRNVSDTDSFYNGMVSADPPQQPGQLVIDKQATKVSGTSNQWDITLTLNGKNKQERTDVVFVIDTSGSMDEQGRMQAAKNAAKKAIEILIPASGPSNIKAAIVSFADTAVIKQNLTGSRTDLITAVNGLGADGATFTQGGIHVARGILDASTAKNKFMVLLSDGEPTYSYDVKDGYKSYSAIYSSGLFRTNYETLSTMPVTLMNYNSGAQGGGNDVRWTKEGFLVGDFYHVNCGNQAIAEAGFFKNPVNPNKGIYAVGLSLDADGKAIMNKIDSSGTAQAATTANLTSIFTAIANKIAFAAKAATLTDPMGEMFNIVPPVSDVQVSTHGGAFAPMSGDATSDIYYVYDSVTDKYTFKIKEVSEALSPMVIKYRVVLDTTQPGFVLGQAYPTNGDTYIEYTDSDGNSVTKHFPQIPSVGVDATTISMNYVRVDASNKLLKLNGEQAAGLNDALICESVMFSYNGSTSLPPGTYDLTASDTVTDLSGNTYVLVATESVTDSLDVSHATLLKNATVSTADGNSKVVYYAYKLQDQAVVTFNPGVGTGTSGTQNLTVGVEANLRTVSDLGFAGQTGYVFDKWTGNGGEYADGASITAASTSAITLTAQWKKDTSMWFDIIYNGNGATSGTAPATVNVMPGTYTLAGNPGNLAINGYTFKGWADSSSSSTVIEQVTIVAANVTVYAVWEKTTGMWFSVTYNGNENTGGTAPTDADTYMSGTSVTSKAAGDLSKTGHTFNGWNSAADGSGTITVAAGSAFTMPDSNVTLYAKWTLNTYTITATAGSNGSIDPSGNVTVNHGASQTFTFAANEGYEINQVKINGSVVSATSPYTFTNVTANQTIDVTFKIKVYTITASAGAGGSISPNGAVSVNHGANQSFAFTANEGYLVDQVKVDGVVTTATSSYTFSNVTANHTIDVTFKLKTYTITASAGANGSISPSGNVTVNYGDNQTFTITPNTGYAVDALSVDGTGVTSATTYTFSNVTGDHTINVTFKQITYTITASAGANGSISPSGAVSVNHGDNQTFTFAANEGYQVDQVKVDGAVQSQTVSYTFSNVIANHTIEVTFKQITYTITASAGANGTISPSGAVSVNHGSDQTFTFSPSVGYQVDQVKVDDAVQSPTPASYTFSNVTANHTINVTFKQITYTITASAGANGTISPSGAVSVNHGSDQTFTFSPSVGYQVDQVKVDDAVQSPTPASYTFSNVTANHTINVTFKQITYTITASAGTNGTISPSGAVSVNYGASQTFTITPASGYQVDVLTVDGSTAVSAESYAFNNVTADHTIDVTFKLKTYTITATTGSNGTISPSGDVTVNHGADQAFTFSPSVGYQVDQVKVDNVAQSPTPVSYTFNNVTANHTIDVTFKQITYTITASAGNNGIISPSGDVTVNHGDNQTFTFSPSVGYQVDQVKVDGVEQSLTMSYTFNNVIANHTIEVTFKQITYTITATAGTNGSISPNGDVTVNYGTSQEFTFSPSVGYQVDNVKVDGVEQSSTTSYTFNNVIANHTIDVTFKQITYTITASAGTNGSISPNGDVTVNYGASQEFTFSPSVGYQVDQVKVDGEVQSLTTSYTFTNVTANHTIEVTFKLKTYTISLASSNVTVTGISDGQVVEHGQTVTFKVTANAGYRGVAVTFTIGGQTSILAPVEGMYTINGELVVDNITVNATARPVPGPSPGPVEKYYTVTASYNKDYISVSGIPESGVVKENSRLYVTIGQASSTPVIVHVSVTMGGIPILGAFVYDEGTQSSGRVVIDEVTGDVTISAQYEIIPAENPTDSDGFPWWILLVIAIVCFILLLIYYRRRTEEEDETGA